MLNALELACLAAIWGSSYLFMRIASPDIGPIPLIFVRVGIAALALSPVLVVARNAREFRARWRHIAVVGLTNSAIPFMLLAWSLLHVGAGLDAILTATTPIWAALMAAAMFGRAILPQVVAGMVVALAGIAMLMGDAMPSIGQVGLFAALAAVLVAVCYAYAAHHSRRHLAGVSPLVVAAGSQLVSALALAPFAAMCWPRHAVGAPSVACAGALGLVCTALAYILYFRLLARAGVAIASSVTMLIPLFGVIWGAVFLGEPVTCWTLAGGVTTLAGLAMTMRPAKAEPADRLFSAAPGRAGLARRIE